MKRTKGRGQEAPRGKQIATLSENQGECRKKCLERDSNDRNQAFNIDQDNGSKDLRKNNARFGNAITARGNRSANLALIAVRSFAGRGTLARAKVERQRQGLLQLAIDGARQPGREKQQTPNGFPPIHAGSRNGFAK